jgi:apoptosis-inducing factor 2
MSTGQTPNIEFLSGLEASEAEPLTNPTNNFIRVRPTLQFDDPRYPHIFAVGDIADTGAHKAARPGMCQAKIAAKNILSLIHGQRPTENLVLRPAGIHLTLGLVSGVKISKSPECAH